MADDNVQTGTFVFQALAILVLALGFIGVAQYNEHAITGMVTEQAIMPQTQTPSPVPVQPTPTQPTAPVPKMTMPTDFLGMVAVIVGLIIVIAVGVILLLKTRKNPSADRLVPHMPHVEPPVEKLTAMSARDTAIEMPEPVAAPMRPMPPRPIARPVEPSPILPRVQPLPPAKPLPRPSLPSSDARLVPMSEHEDHIQQMKELRKELAKLRRRAFK